MNEQRSTYVKNESHPQNKRESHSRTKRREGRLPAAAHRSRQSQKRENVEKEMSAAEAPFNSAIPAIESGQMTDESTTPHEPALHDSEEPPPPQLRRARTTSDPSKKVKDKNTGIKGRDSSGKKHSAQERSRARH
jgi:hypothetical protein